MSTSDSTNNKSWKSRLSLAVAGFALAGALAAGAVAATDVDPVSADDTTETAGSWQDTWSQQGFGLSWQ